jgi:hypothetical protein
MVGIASLLTFLGLALVITRVATVALRTTGLSHESARFQARSAFTGVGLSTEESDEILKHPARRNIVLMLMSLSGAGVVTTLASLLASFADLSSYRQGALRLAVLSAGLLVLWRISESRRVERHLASIIEWGLARWTDLDARDYVRLLHIDDEYSIAEIGVDENDWLADRAIGELGLAGEGIVALGVRHADGRYSGAPSEDTVLRVGDTVVLYGRTAVLDELQGRQVGPAGDLAHERAIAAHRRLLERARVGSAARKRPRPGSSVRGARDAR